MSTKAWDSDYAVDRGSGNLHTSGHEPYTWRHGTYKSPHGIASIYAEVNEKGVQYVRIETVRGGRHYMHAEQRDNRHLTERGIFTVAGRWLRRLDEGE